jgi:VWFA-related protein
MWQRSTLCLLLAIAGLYLAVCQRAFAQSEAQKKREDFGSSLKRLKWDTKKEAAVEVKDKEAKNKKDKKAKKGEAPLAEIEEVIRIETVLAVFDLLVVDKKGRAIKGLTKDDFVVKEDGKLQQIGTFAMGDDVNRPRSIVLVIDYSGSQLPYLQTSIAAAKMLVAKLNPQDKMAIVTDDISLLVDFTKDKEKLKSSLDSLEQRALWGRGLGRSAQYSALLATLKELVVGEERPIILLQTDGDELKSLQPMADRMPPMMRASAKEFSLTDIVAAAQKAHTTIYSIISGLRFIGLPPDEQIERARLMQESRGAAMAMRAGPGFDVRRARLQNDAPEAYYIRTADNMVQQQAALATVAKLTGGWPEFLERPDQAANIYSRILTDINRRYIIGYYPTNTARDGKLRKVNFEVRNHPEYVVWGRKSYYAPER